MKKNKLLSKAQLITLSILFTFVITSHALGASYYVDGSCSSSGNGTTPTCGASGPWKALAEAASGVPNNANHTISVKAGTYSGFADSRNGSSPGYRHWLASGTVRLSSPVTLSGTYIKLEGFTFISVRYPLFLP